MTQMNRNAFEKRITEGKPMVPTISTFMAKNGMMVGGASLALGVMMMGGTFLSGQVGLKADATETTTATATPIVVNAPAEESLTTENTTATSTATSNEPATTTDTKNTTTTSTTATTNNTPQDTTTTSQVVTSSVDANPTATPMAIAESERAEMAPAPNEASVSVPAALLQVDENDLMEALEGKQPEVIPAESIE